MREVTAFVVAMVSTLAVLMVAEHHWLASTNLSRIGQGRRPRVAPAALAGLGNGKAPETQEVDGHSESRGPAASSRQLETDMESFFRVFDDDGSGWLDMEELGRAFASTKRQYTREQIEVLHAAFDVNNSGGVTLEELRAGARQLMQSKTRQRKSRRSRGQSPPAALNLSTALQHCIYHVHGFTHSGTGVLRHLLHELAGPRDASTQHLDKCCEHEGQYAQDVYPQVKQRRHAHPSKFNETDVILATYAPRFLVEISTQKQEALLRQWSAAWDVSRRTLIQKTPTFDVAFLDQMIPGSAHAIIMRHPFNWHSRGHGNNADVAKMAPELCGSRASCLRVWLTVWDRVLRQLAAGPIRRWVIVRYESLLQQSQDRGLPPYFSARQRYPRLLQWLQATCPRDRDGGMQPTADGRGPEGREALAGAGEALGRGVDGHVAGGRAGGKAGPPRIPRSASACILWEEEHSFASVGTPQPGGGSAVVRADEWGGVCDESECGAQ